MRVMISLLLAVMFSVSNATYLFAQEMAAPPMGAMGGMGMAGHGGKGAAHLPPLIRAKIDGVTAGGVLLHDAKKGENLEFEVFVGHPDKGQKISYKTIGMPPDAKLDLKENKEHHSYEGKFSWTPSVSGIHGFIIEASSDKGGVNRLAVFINAK
jgi:hypothetical protein